MPREIEVEKMADLLTMCLSIMDEVLECPERLNEGVPEMQKLVWSHKGEGAEWEVLSELAYDLDFYVSDPSRRAEDSLYYGDERALAEIGSARTKLRRILEHRQY